MNDLQRLSVDAVRVLSGEDLHETLGLVHGAGAAVRDEGELALPVGDARLRQLLFGPADAGDLGVRVDDPGDHVVVHVPVPRGDDLRAGDTLVLRLVGEHRAPDHVPDGIDPLGLRAERVGNGDAAALVRLDAHRVQAEPLRQRLASLHTFKIPYRYDASWFSRLRHLLRIAQSAVRGTLSRRPIYLLRYEYPAFVRLAAELAEKLQPDLIQIEYSVLCSMRSALPATIPVVLDTHEVRSLTALRALSGSSRPGWPLYALELASWIETLAHLDGFVITGDTGINVCRQFQQGITCHLRTFRTTFRISSIGVLAYGRTEDILDGYITTETDFSASHRLILCQIHDGGIACNAETPTAGVQLVPLDRRGDAS